MSKQRVLNPGLAERNGSNGFAVAVVLGAVFALLYGLWLVYPTPESSRLLQVDAYSASFLVIGTGQVIGMAQRRYRLLRTMGILAVLIWILNAYYSFEPVQLVFPAIALCGFLQISWAAEDANQAAMPVTELTTKQLRSMYSLKSVSEIGSRIPDRCSLTIASPFRAARVAKRHSDTWPNF